MSIVGKRILIVEDEPLNRVVYQITLGVGGALLEFDRWGREAVTRLRTCGQWDLIILDLMLRGGVSGFDVFREIRAMPEYAQIPIVAISASEPSTAIPTTREVGFSGFISKPIDESLIIDQIMRLMAGEQVWYDGTLMGRGWAAGNAGV